MSDYPVKLRGMSNEDLAAELTSLLQEAAQKGPEADFGPVSAVEQEMEDRGLMAEVIDRRL